jgi:VanZ family protein
MFYRERASVVATLVVLGLILDVFMQLPTWTHEVTVLGSPLTISVSQTVLMAALLIGITCSGTDVIVRSHPTARRIEARYSFVTWTLPALTVLLATVLLPQAPTRLYRLAGLVLTGLILTLVISAEYYTVDPSDRRYLAARLSLNAWAYLLALMSFVIIYSPKARSLLSATAVTVVATLLALELLRGAGRGFGRTALYALIAGLITGEIIWAMNYWRIGGVTGGLLLLLGFYVAAGLANQQLQDRLTRRVLIEYGVVALIGLVILLQFQAVQPI